MKLPALLLHGFTGASASWQPVVDALPGRVLHRPALLGHGAPKAGVTSFEAEVDRLVAAVPEDAFVVAGYSLGARLALGALVRHPTRVSAALLIGGHPGLVSSVARAQRRQQDAERAAELRDHGVASFVDGWERSPLFASQLGLPSALRAHQRSQRLAHDAEGLARSLEVLGLGAMPPYGESLGRVPQPVRLLVGELDEKFSALAVGSLAALPNGALDRVPGVGHNVLLERPEAVARALAACLEAGTERRQLVS